MPTITIPTLRFSQTERRLIYLLAMDSMTLQAISGVNRIARTAASDVLGYQRIEQSRHVLGIQRYLDSSDPMIPNCLVLALDQRVSFSPERTLSGTATLGGLSFPIDEAGETPLAWIVDGQQRAAAMRQSSRQNFQIAVSAFFPTDYDDERQQFILVNSAKPLPSSLILELLPHTSGPLPDKLARRKTAAAVSNVLNLAESSSLKGQIKTITNPGGSIRDNTIIRLIENSLTEGVLYNFRNSKTGDGNVLQMAQLISEWFWAVRNVFPDDWKLDSHKSRLRHGAGLIALGSALDEFCAHAPEAEWTLSRFTQCLEQVRPGCAWSSGSWVLADSSSRKWDQFQNTSQDIRLLSRTLTLLVRKTFAP